MLHVLVTTRRRPMRAKRATRRAKLVAGLILRRAETMARSTMLDCCSSCLAEAQLAMGAACPPSLSAPRTRHSATATVLFTKALANASVPTMTRRHLRSRASPGCPLPRCWVPLGPTWVRDPAPRAVRRRRLHLQAAERVSSPPCMQARSWPPSRPSRPGRGPGWGWVVVRRR